ncbi:MAG: ABC transporter permease [Thermoplasmata archaeon]|nr:ABC transporter permease [Thermoplasmata archaeon]
MNRRIFATILGIAFCSTYLAGTISMVGGLHDTTSTLAASFDQGPLLVYTDEDFAVSRIDASSLPGNNTTFVAFCFTNVTLRDFHGRASENVYVASVYDPKNTLGFNMTDETANSGVWMGNKLVEMLAADSIPAVANMSYILAKEDKSVSVYISYLYSQDSVVPDDWLLIPRDKMDMLRPDLVGNYSFLMIVDSEVQYEEQADFPEDAEASPTTGVLGYFEAGIFQVEKGLWGIIFMSGLITALLVYCIISIETEYSGPTIRVLRGIGASREYVVRIFVLKALFITLFGGILGTAMGFCAASAVSSVSSVMNIMSFIRPLADARSVLLPLAISLLSGFIGGLWPAIKASRMFAPRRGL